MSTAVLAQSSSVALVSRRHSITHSTTRRSTRGPIFVVRSTSSAWSARRSLNQECRARGLVVVRAEAADGKAPSGDASPVMSLDDSQLSNSELQDLQDMQEILETIELLKTRRDMTIQEIRLILLIEDPREAERRRQMGIENESGCSRDEIADAFVEVCEDRVPADRMVLRKLAQEMRDWPRLREEISAEELAASRSPRSAPSPYARITDVGLKGGAQANKGAKADKKEAAAAAGSSWDDVVEQVAAAAKEEKEQEKDLGNKLPKWVGYGVLYGFSIIPIIIGVIVVVILFLNSLQ